MNVPPIGCSPPRPMPQKIRSTASWYTLVTSAQANVKNEYIRIVIISALTRPKRSATGPHTIEAPHDLAAVLAQRGRDEWARHVDVIQTCATSASADSMSGFGYAT